MRYEKRRSSSIAVCPPVNAGGPRSVLSRHVSYYGCATQSELTSSAQASAGRNSTSAE